MTDISNLSTLRQIPNLTLNPDAPAIRLPSATTEGTGEELSYTAMSNLVQHTAMKLKTELGVTQKDLVSIVMPNTLPFVLSFVGVTWCRGIAAPLNPNYTESEYKFYMEDAGSKLLLIPTEGANQAAVDAAKAMEIPVYTVAWSAENPTEVTFTHQSGPKQLHTPPTTSEEAEAQLNPEPDDVCLFLHTSGTTARPKGVPLTHANLLASMRNIIATYSMSPSDVNLLIMPLFHIHGLMAALFSTLASGGCVTLPPEGRFSAGKFWSYATWANITWFTGVPTMHQILLARHADDYPHANPPKLRFVRSCSSSLAPAILTQIESKFGAPCLEAYAMTEAAHQMSSNPFGNRKPGTVGKGTGVEIVIMKADGKTVETEPGVQGEVCIKGANVFGGYNNVKPEVNVESFLGGYFHTGDQGMLDAEGFLTLTGRIKELINRGGEKISPLEVDAAMLSHDKVGEAVSFAMPDEKYGEIVGAAIVPKKLEEIDTFDVDELKEFLKTKLGTFKIPVKIFVADALPKTATGKIQRRIVSAHFLEKKDG